MTRATRSAVALLTILLGLLGAACGDPEPDPGHTDTTTTTADSGDAEGDVYTGHYSTGFEVSAFVECGSDEQWWVVGSAELTEEVEAAADSPPYEPVYLRVRGTLSEPGTYGHLGAYQRQLTVTEVLDVSVEKSC
ncbi:MAG: hypothetical protein IT198_08710 [Acidimicrobiia bacterium]|nr:hypothetical protein [Acidimicrobiia bacterium]